MHDIPKDIDNKHTSSRDTTPYTPAHDQAVSHLHNLLRTFYSSDNASDCTTFGHPRNVSCLQQWRNEQRQAHQAALSLRTDQASAHARNYPAWRRDLNYNGPNFFQYTLFLELLFNEFPFWRFFFSPYIIFR